jgi:hypothetical protein
MILVGNGQIINGWLWLESKFLVQSLRLVLRRYYRHLFGKVISSTGDSVSVLLVINSTKRNVLFRFLIGLSLKFFV